MANSVVTLEKKDDKDKFIKELSKTIQATFEERLIWAMINRHLAGVDEEQKKEVFALAQDKAAAHENDMLSKVHYNRRLALIQEELDDYFSQNASLNLVGLIRFRLRAYKKQLKDIVAEAWHEYNIRAEYDEFIDMLSFFVSVQSTKENTVIIVKKKNELRILNRMKRDITKQYRDENIMYEDGMTEEDIILSELIYIAPKKIIIQDNKDALPLYETITKVFDKVVFV